MNYFKHESAFVDAGANIGEGSKIWHFCHIMKDTEIGKGVILGQNVFVASGVKIGDFCKVQNNVSLYKGVIIEEDVFLGPSMVFTNVYNPRSFVERKSEFRPTLIKKGATVGANATIVCGITIGQYGFVGAGTVVLNDVPNFGLVVGNPARQIGWVSKRGNKLEFNATSLAVCPEDGSQYRLENNTIRPLPLH